MEIVKKTLSQKLIKQTIYVLIGSILLTISAKVKIPFYPVPMTMQTFVVLLLGISLGPKVGTMSVILYLAEGILGIPVFSNSPEKGSGIIYFTGPTMGYLIGFIFASFLAGKINYKSNILIIFLKLILVVSVIYILGMAWLGFLLGWDKPIFDIGAKPFLLAEVAKILLLAVITKQLVKFRRSI